MKRREFITLLGGGAAWPLAARAQQPAKLPTIGFLGQSTRSAASEWTAAFVQRLRELGRIEGRTVAIEYRWAEGREERFAEIAAEFVRLKVDVIVTSGTPAVMASKKATSVIPIVCDGGGPSRHRASRKSGASGRQRHRFVEPNGRYWWQETRTLARGRPWSQPFGGHGQCRQSPSCAGDERRRPARSASRSLHRRSGESRISRPASN
jgi:ABC transporter substrate binding protein